FLIWAKAQLCPTKFYFMAYDPTLPANNSPIVSAELRNQYAGLKEEIDDKVSNQDLNNNSSANSNQVQFLGMIASDPPTQGDVQSIADKVDELIQQLRR
ncbi:MAG TPA: hypothetical protein VN516_04230, partial [Candidatus Baltobacteraceae bacterium]|nr:hypothetical protein [Candidatus Baltobacteraceae bacterium]